ncbi:MAG: 2-isopropylmalate synthase [Thaumarchaeota archaeon]|nr:2-isopropylmalate synthase [Candidatus Calditenuaceae archaeon]MDW8187391.1 2-isopropylmalate synthase [Nitrososphaerota archaeon]
MSWKDVVRGEYLSLPERVQVFDTTLRDGEQTPGVSLRRDEKVAIAGSLAELGVAVIEAGYPAVSKGEFESVREVSRLGLGSKVCALARCDRRDIDQAVDAGVDWVHVFIATSEIHMTHKLKMTPEQVYQTAIESVEYARSRGVGVHFSCEDATRSERSFLLKVYKGAAEAGAHSLDIPDTVGVAIPLVMRELARSVKAATGLPVAVHCHDDMGLATANTIAGVEGGAEIVHVTINGIGERAGNASLEEVVVALKYLYGIDCGIDLKKLASVSRMVANLTGMQVQKNKAIVGDHAFSHESGIHVHGIINNPYTYEPIMPEVVGKRRKIVIGKHSGTHAVLEVLKQHGFELNFEEGKRVLSKVKDYADRGLRLTEHLLLRLVRDDPRLISTQPFEVVSLTVEVDNDEVFSEVEVLVRGESMRGSGKGKSSILASIEAISSVISKVLGPIEVVEYSIYVPPNPDRYPAEAEALVKFNGVTLVGRGLAHDPSLAIAMAIGGAVSQALTEKGGEVT